MKFFVSFILLIAVIVGYRHHLNNQARLSDEALQEALAERPTPTNTSTQKFAANKIAINVPTLPNVMNQMISHQDSRKTSYQVNVVGTLEALLAQKDNPAQLELELQSYWLGDGHADFSERLQASLTGVQILGKINNDSLAALDHEWRKSLSNNGDSSAERRQHLLNLAILATRLESDEARSRAADSLSQALNESSVPEEWVPQLRGILPISRQPAAIEQIEADSSNLGSGRP